MSQQSQRPGVSDGAGNRHAAVVYNPTKVDLDELRRIVEKAADEHDWGRTKWLETSADDPGVQMARDAVDGRADVVLAAGGDGTVRAVTEALRGTGVPLALLPAGTGNLLARNLGVPLNDLADCVAAAFEGKDRDLDLGMIEIRRANGDIDTYAFSVMAGMGLDAQMMSNTDSGLKDRIGWMAYGQSLLRAVQGGRRIKMMYRYDSEGPQHGRVHTILIGNCGMLPGKIALLPDAKLDDGILDIVTLRPDGPLGWAQISWKIMIENGILHRSGAGQKLTGVNRSVRALNYQRAEQIEVRLAEPEPIELDGDSFGEATGLRAWAEPHALKVKIPSGAPEGAPSTP